MMGQATNSIFYVHTTPAEPDMINSSCLNDGTYTDPGHDKHGLSHDDLVIQEIPPK
jgi:hypothetical protein